MVGGSLCGHGSGGIAHLGVGVVVGGDVGGGGGGGGEGGELLAVEVLAKPRPSVAEPNLDPGLRQTRSGRMEKGFGYGNVLYY